MPHDHPSAFSITRSDPTRTTRPAQEVFSVAGVLVTTRPSCLPGVVSALSSVPGVEVHHQDPATGRLVVTLERPTIADQETGLSVIQGLAGVMGAALVFHYFAPADTDHGCPAVAGPQGVAS